MSLQPQRHYGPERRMPHPVKSDNYQRASDAERQAVIEQLRLNCAEGRLTMDEFGERTSRSLGASTGGELRHLLADLPIMVAPPSAEERADRKRQVRLAILLPYVLVNMFLVLVWAATGGGYFWPIWPILGWGLGVGFALLGVSRSDGQRFGDPAHRSGFAPGQVNR